MLSATSVNDPWIRRYHASADNAIRLVCFPHAGGSANYYLSLSESLAPAIEVLAVQYPGRQDRHQERRVENISDLADLIFAALKSWNDRPFAFFGHSLGAILAFEVARRFQQLDQAPVRLFVSGRAAPTRYRNDWIHRRDDTGVVAELHRIGGTDRALLNDPELLKLILPTIRSDYKALETYVFTPAPPLNCAITALIGTSDPKVTAAEAAAWAEQCAGEFELYTFPGGHFYLDERQPEVIDAITGSLYSRRTRCARPMRRSMT